MLDAEIVDIKLARSASGPIIALLGTDRTGSTPIGNANLSSLVDGDAQLWLFTASDPANAVKASLEP